MILTIEMKGVNMDKKEKARVKYLKALKKKQQSESSLISAAQKRNKIENARKEHRQRVQFLSNLSSKTEVDQVVVEQSTPKETSNPVNRDETISNTPAM